MLNIDYKVIETFPQKMRDILDKELVEGNAIVEAKQYNNNSIIVLKYPFMTEPVYDKSKIFYNNIKDSKKLKSSYTYIDENKTNRYMLVCEYGK